MTPRLRGSDDGDSAGQGRRARVTRRPQPRYITLGGREAVALTPEEYERLIVSRRQIGGQSARVRVLAHQVKRTEELLRDLEVLVRSSPGGLPRPVRAGRRHGIVSPHTDGPERPATGPHRQGGNGLRVSALRAGDPAATPPRPAGRAGFG